MSTQLAGLVLMSVLVAAPDAGLPPAPSPPGRVPGKPVPGGKDPLSIMGLAATGAQLWAAGRTRTGSFEVRMAARTPSGMRWSHRIPVSQDQVDELTLTPAVSESADGGVRLAVARRGSSWHGSILLFSVAASRWAPAGAIAPLDPQFDFGAGLLLRGDELFTFEEPGGRVHRPQRARDGGWESNVGLWRFHREGAGWQGAPLELPAEVEIPWWYVALSPDGSTLVVTTCHRDQRYFAEVYRRSTSGELRFSASIPLGAQPSAIALTDRQLFVGMSRPEADGAVVRVFEESSAGWTETKRIRTPAPSAAAFASQLERLGDSVVLAQLDSLWVVDRSHDRPRCELELPPGQLGKLRRPSVVAMGRQLVASVENRLVLYPEDPCAAAR